MEEVIRYLSIGIGIGTLVMGLWCIYCISQFGKRSK